ncbi:MAG: ROK family protein [bacterium]
MNLLGIDIGGTKSAVCLGNQKGEILATKRMNAAPGEDPQIYSQRLSALIFEVLAQTGLDAGMLDAVGISAPGPLSVPRGILLAPPNNPGWRDVPIVKMVSEVIKAPVFFNNDANACALAEMYFGEYSGTRNLIYLTFSTGMGAGIITNGSLVQGANDCGGEVGHMVLDLKGPLCGCGHYGCWEAYVGGRNLAERLKTRIRTGGLKTAILDQAGGDVDKIDMKALTSAVRLGDPLALEEWETLMDRLAQGIGALIQVINPEVVILGTIAIRERELVMPALHAKLPKYTWSWPLEACRIVPSSLEGRIGDLSALAVAVTGLSKTGSSAM